MNSKILKALYVGLLLGPSVTMTAQSLEFQAPQICGQDYPAYVAVNPGDIYCYPQPVVDTICFAFNAPSAGEMTIQVYTVQLKRAATFTNNVLTAGQNYFCVDVGPLAPGGYIYFASLAGYNFPTRKLWVER